MYKLQLVLYVALSVSAGIELRKVLAAVVRASPGPCAVRRCENGKLTYARASAVCFTPEGSLDTLNSPVANPMLTGGSKGVI